MKQETTYDFPLRYFSVTTVAKEFTPKPDLPDGGAIDIGVLLSAMSEAKSEVSALTPYLFLLFETEEKKPCWQYLDMAGRLSHLHYCDEASHVEVKKITFDNGAYMYRVEEVFLQRKSGK